MSTDYLPSAPLVLNWALSNRCNFRCSHCYSRTEPDDELDGQTLRELLAAAAAVGVLSVQFGGGEPLLREDLLELVAWASSLGLSVSMNSNGWLLDAEAARDLKRAGITKVGISIDSPSAAVHDAFRGVAGSHARAVAALEHLADADIETSVSCVVCSINVEHLAELVDLAVSVGAGNLGFHDFKCSGLGYANRAALDLSPAAWRDFYGRAFALRSARKDVRILLEDPITAALGEGAGGSLVQGSVCGKLSLCIKSNADITPCGFIPTVIGNLLVNDLAEVWRRSSLLAAMRNKRKRGKCRTCSHHGQCLGGCSARALALTGDLENPDPHCWHHESGIGCTS